MAIDSSLLRELLGIAGLTTISGQDAAGIEQVIVLDATIRRSYTDEVEVAVTPSESTLRYANDNVRGMPPVLTVSGVMSETPLMPLEMARAIRGPGRAKAAYDVLLAMLDLGEPVKVTTDLRVYTSVVLRTVSVEEDANTGDALFVTVSFQHANILTTKTRPVVLDAQVRQAGAGGTADMGVQALIEGAVP